MAFSRSRSGLITRRWQGNTLTLSRATLPTGLVEWGSGRLQFNGISAYRVGSSRRAGPGTLNDVPEVPALILRILGHVYRRRAPRLRRAGPGRAGIRAGYADPGRRFVIIAGLGGGGRRSRDKSVLLNGRGIFAMIRERP